MPDLLNVILHRGVSTDQGTFSHLFCSAVGVDTHVLELPDRDNEPRMSRIPAGTYKCVPFKSPKFGRVWMITGVPNRSYVLFHRGNFAGDTSKGWRTDSHGCLLTFTFRGRLCGQNVGLNAARAFGEMRDKIGLSNSFYLTIIE